MPKSTEVNCWNSAEILPVALNVSLTVTPNVIAELADLLATLLAKHLNVVDIQMLSQQISGAAPPQHFDTVVVELLEIVASLCRVYRLLCKTMMNLSKRFLSPSKSVWNIWKK